MFERFTHSAREIVIAAQEHARRLGHRQIGTPHLLLALLDSDAGDTLRSHGVTRETVERELDGLLSRDPRAGEDDAEVLAALGIDVARIREAVEASFGPGALDRALDDPHDTPPGLLARLTGGRLGSGRLGGALPRDEVAALRRPARRPSTRLPFSPAAKKTLELSLREAIRLGDRGIDADHLVLGMLRGADGAAAAVLTALGVDAGAVRTTIEGRHRRSA